MRDEGSRVTSLKQQLYHHTIDATQYAAAIAPIRARHGWVFDFWNIHWLYYTQMLFVTTAVLMLVLSYLTRAPDPGTLRFTWYGASAAEKAATRASWDAVDVLLSIVVLAAVVVFYITFW
jgi:SSS family solute:Na+ symporter